MTQSRETSLWNTPPLSWLISLRVGIILIALLIAASILGTLISPLERAQALVFYSWWYEALLLAVVLNISATTIYRVFCGILPARRLDFQCSPSFYRSCKPSCNMPFEGSAQDAAAVFERAGFRTSFDHPYGCAKKGMLGIWGSTIAHVGFVIVLVASFAAGLVSSEGRVAIGEGETADSMYLLSSPYQPTPMGFSIRCDDFETGFFPRTHIPSNFVSTIAVLDKAGSAEFAQVEVNRTFKTHGWTIHQSSFEEIPDAIRYELAIHQSGSTTTTIHISPGQQRPVPGMAGLEIHLGDSSPLAWRMTRAGKSVAEGAIGEQKPAATGWNVQILGEVKSCRTILSLTRNPMIPLIYAGCATLVLGLFVAFFLNRRTIYFWVDEQAGQLRVAGVYRQSQSEFDKAARRALSQIPIRK